MYATKLRGRITNDRRLVVAVPNEITPGAVEVILLRLTTAPAKRRARRVAHPAFGIWANRADITDAATFAAQLRRRVETHADAN